MSTPSFKRQRILPNSNGRMLEGSNVLITLPHIHSPSWHNGYTPVVPTNGGVNSNISSPIPQPQNGNNRKHVKKESSILGKRSFQKFDVATMQQR